MERQKLLERIYNVGRWDSWGGGNNPPSSCIESVGILDYKGKKLRYTINYFCWGCRDPERTLVIYGMIDREFDELEGKDPRKIPSDIEINDLEKVVRERFPKYEVKIIK